VKNMLGNRRGNQTAVGFDELKQIEEVEKDE